MKSKLTGALLVACLVQAACVRGGDLLSGMKEQVSLPPNVAAFIAAKEQQAYSIVAKNDFTVPPELADYFAAAKAGRALEARKIYSGLLKDTNSPAFGSPLNQVALDVELTLEAYATGDSNLVTGLANDFMNLLPTGCIYFGGTDPGRGLPTMLCSSPGNPIYVITQNALVDGRYLNLLRMEFGSKMNLPDTNAVKEIVDAAYADKGKAGFNSWKAWATASGQILQKIISLNPDREIYYEQSFVIDDLISRLSPHELVMKINHQPLSAITDDEIKASDNFWSAKIRELTNNPALATDDYTRKAYAHCRGAIAGLYAWRAQSAKDMAEHERMFAAATNAFGQSLALDATMPETIYTEVNLFLGFGKPDLAMNIATNALAVDPANEQLKTLAKQLPQMIAAAAANNAPHQSQPAPAKPATERLKQLEALYQQGLINKEDYERKKKEILDSL